MRPRKITAAMITLVVVGAILASTPAASAQEGYPPPLCPPGDTVHFAGTRSIGDAFTVRLAPTCLWDPGALVSLTVSGQRGGTKVADAGGGVNVDVTAGQCGENKVSGVGHSSAARAPVVATAVFTVLCEGREARPDKGGVALTGADIARWTLLAVGLVGVGALLVRVARRRRGRRLTA